MNTFEANGRPDLVADTMDMSLEKVATYLREFRQPVMVRLEPGDATRYAFMLIPCDHHNVRSTLWDRFGINPREAGAWISLTLVGPSVGHDFIRMDRLVAEHDLAQVVTRMSPPTAAYTAILLAEWLNKLRTVASW